LIPATGTVSPALNQPVDRSVFHQIGLAVHDDINNIDYEIKYPVVYLNGVTNFVSNCIGDLNTIKISDISGAIPASGRAIAISAWDVNGNAIPGSVRAASLKLNNHGTTSISGSNLAARFPTGSPMIYEFAVQSTKLLVTNVKKSTDGTLNIPIAYTSGVSNFVSNSIGNNNTLKISDLSDTLPSGGGAISVKAWDANGNALYESVTAVPLTLHNHGTTSISGSNLAARFPTGQPMTYDFSIKSSKVLITNVKSSTDDDIEIPSIFTSGISNFAINYFGHGTVIKISDMSGTLPAVGAAISIAAWDTNGNALPEASGYAPPIMLRNHETITILDNQLSERFTSDFPVLYEFSIGSSSVIVTSITMGGAGPLFIPTVFTIGPYSGI
jgi:hypothetical protein